ncbi:MAG TPA: adenine deaminase [Bacteroidetes bacterium]|nr:adenine deaminase [Bacteroidota bacterium]
MKNYKVKGRVVDITKKKIYRGEIMVKDGKIYKISRTPDTKEENDRFIMPGLVDAHVHIESSMLTPGYFARECVRHGTVAVVSDPHEIANVMGMEGIDYMIREGKKVPVKYAFGASSCVPATELETSGAKLGSDKIRELMKREDITYLAEMMNFPGVITRQRDVIEKINIAREFGKPIDGHAPGLKGEPLKKYIGEGISTNHEASTLEEAEEKINNGMKILIREGSAARNFEALIPLMKSYAASLMFCTDDMHPDDLINGHINMLVKRAVRKGYDLFDVLRAATMNPVNHYGLNVGLLREGDPADFIVVDHPENMQVLETYIEGVCVYREGQTMFHVEKPGIINRFHSSSLHDSDIRVKAGKGKMIVIQAVDGELLTERIICEPKREGEYVVADPGRDLLKLVYINRYRSMPPAVAFVRGFGLREGAFGSSISHDSHNILVVGVNDEDIYDVARVIMENRGGVVAKKGEKTDLLPLPVAGLMSDRDAPWVASRYQGINRLIRSMGSTLHAPVMTLSFLSLLVIPHIKLGEKGLFDTETFSFIPMFIPNGGENT